MFEKAKPYFQAPFRYDPEGQMIFDGNGNRVLDVRGWGHLHGLGACALELPLAEEIQDAFGEEMAALLTANWLRSTPDHGQAVENVILANHPNAI